MTDTAKGTVLKLLAEIGNACAEYQDKTLRNLSCKRIPCDEIWAFCYAKEKNVAEDKKGQFGYGDMWTFTAHCADSKLVPSWYIEKLDIENATVFMSVLAGCMKNRVQLTTDGHKMYLEAIENAFSSDIDFSQLIKLYGESPENEIKYSSVQCTGTKVERIAGNPDPRHVSTTFVERQNLTME